MVTPQPVTATYAPCIPTVLHVGFSGARKLFDSSVQSTAEADLLAASLVPLLQAELNKLRQTLDVVEPYFFCGVSSLAAGADTLFTRACQASGWSQRIFLPQQENDFFSGVGKRGTDFTDLQAASARELLQSDHLIEERVVSNALKRDERFQDVNLEILDLADVVVCLLPTQTTAGKPGGTDEFLQHAKDKRLPALELRLAINESGAPCLHSTWHNADAFQRPLPPVALKGIKPPLKGIPAMNTFCASLEAHSNQRAQWRQKLFHISAMVIVGTHVTATMLAVLALKLGEAGALPWLLGFELFFLAVGLGTHQYLHATHATPAWAMARLLAETARSCTAFSHVRAPITHLATLPLPTELRPVLRTLDALHLRDARALVAADWHERRDSYIAKRLASQMPHHKGQIAYYRDESKRAQRQHRLAYCLFLAGSVGAVAVTGWKLGYALLHIHPPAYLGFFAVALPVFAVATMSLAASRDLEARAHTYRDMLAFLQAQQERLKLANTERAFNRLVLETEVRLLGETANWYSRRAFTSVA